jgi:hypothetical protein
VPWNLVVLRSADIHIVLTNVEAFHSGVGFTTVARFQPDVSENGRGPGGLLPNLWESSGLRLGVGFADGRKAVFRPLVTFGYDKDPPDPMLSHRGRGHASALGGGPAHEFRVDVWLWPLPPPGPLSLVTAWPERGISETPTTVDAGELIDAAARSEQLWEAPPDEPQRGAPFSPR